MEIWVARVAHPSPWVRLVGVHPRARYLEACWTPLLGSGTVELVRCIDLLAGPTDTGPRVVPYTALCELLGLPRTRREDYLRVLGFAPLKRPTLPNRSRINRRLRLAHDAGLIRWQPASHQVELYTPCPIVRPEHIPALPPAAQQHHHAHLDNLADELVDRLAQDLAVADIRAAGGRESSLEYLLRRLKTAADAAGTPQPPQVSP
jgi:hypothetical protein